MSTANIQYHERPGKPKLAYVYSPPADNSQDLPAVMFLGGYRSDMEGTKATWLEEQCRARGQAYLRFDYSGHGVSGGEFTDGTIGIWLEDALSVFDTFPPKPAILVGSSMGGWIALLLSQARPDQVAGLVGIAAAPDFTTTLYEEFTEDQRADLTRQGFVALPNDYSDEPYIFTENLIRDGETRCLLEKDNRFACPVRLVQGMQDSDVPWQTAYRIKNSIIESDVDVYLVEQGDHRLSRPEDLTLIDSQIKALSGL